MAKKPETVFKERVHRDLRKLGHDTGALWFTKTQQVCIRGTPDELLCARGNFIAIELKATPSDKLDGMQWFNLNTINESFGLGVRADPFNWERVFNLVSKVTIGEELTYNEVVWLKNTIGPRPVIKRRQLVMAGKLQGRGARAK